MTNENDHNARTPRAAAAAPRKNPKTGKWDFVVDVGRDPTTGKRRQIRNRGYATKKLAEAELTRIRSSLQSGTFVAPERVTLNTFLIGEWLPAIRPTIESTTLASYEQNVRLHVLPHLGALTLQALDPGHLNGLYARLLETGRTDGMGGLSARTVRYIHTIIHRALRDATRWGKTVRNVADLADPPSRKTARAPEMKYWMPEQLRSFISVTEASRDRLAPAFRLAAMTGLRRGEIAGLTWADVELESATIVVRRQTRTIGRRTEHVDLTKSSAGRRRVDLDAGTVASLRRWKAHQAAEKLACGNGYRETDLVFTQVDGSPVHPQSLTETFARRVKSAGLPTIRLHDLRHTHVAHLLAAGANVKIVSERIGHASSSFTLDRYGHLIEGQQASAAAAVADLVNGAV
jgi:integrase